MGSSMAEDTMEREKEKKCVETKKASFLADFGPDFSHQAMKSTSIYKQWKRAILSTLGKIVALDSVGKDLNC